MKGIRNTILITIGLFILYDLIVRFMPLPYTENYDPWSRNITRAQAFISNAGTADKVIIGSSMAAGIPAKQIGEDYLNLSTEGGNFFSGLEIIKKSKVTPKVILVEINALYREEEYDLPETVFRPVLSQLRKVFPSMLEKNRPIPFLTQYTLMINDKIKYEVSKNIATEKNNTEKTKDKPQNSNSIKNDLIKNKMEFYNSISDSDLINKQLTELVKSLNEFKTAGSRIIIFEMPAHPELVNSKKSVYIRNKVMSAIKENKFCWIPLEKDKSYYPNDMAHLNKADMQDYLTYFKKYLNHNCL